MFKRQDKNKTRQVRHRRVRRKVHGTTERPRVSLYRSLNNIYVQVIDDEAGHTLLAASSLDPEIRDKVPSGGNVAAAKLVGELLGRKAIEKGITKVVFDRGGYRYHGRVKALADGAREAGLEF